MAQDYGITASGEKANVTRGDLARFWPEDLVPNTEQYRFGSTDTDPEVTAAREREIEEMITSLCSEGQLEPVIIRPISGNRFRIHGGDTRYQAFKRINERRIWPWAKAEDDGRARIECIVKKCSDRDAFGQSITENLQRNQLTVIDQANAVQIASDRYQYTDAEIMQKFRQTDPAWLPNMRRLARLPDPLKRRIHLNQMAASVGYLLAEIPEESHAAVLAEAAGEVYPVTESLKRIDAILAEPEHVSIETPAVTCPDCGDYRPNPDNPKICVGCDQPFDMNDAPAPVEQTLDYSESQEPRGSSAKTAGKTSKPKQVTARAVASAAKKRGLLAHKKIANTVAGMKQFWEPLVQDRKGSLLSRMAEAQIAWISGESSDDVFYKHLLAILKEAK